MLGRIGLESLEFEDYDTILMWRRIFILRMVFCLLGIGKCTNLISNCDVDNENIRISEELLAKLDESFEGMDQRRKMFYYVAKARLFQCREHTEEAVMYIRKAEELAVSGNFMEAKFILELRKYLENQVTTELMPNMYVQCEKDATKILSQMNSNEQENETSMTQLNKLPNDSENIQDHFVEFAVTVELANKSSDTVDQQIYTRGSMDQFTNQNAYSKDPGISEIYNADKTFPKEMCKTDGTGLLTVSDAGNKDETSPKEKRWSNYTDVYGTSSIDETSPKEIDVLEICNMEKTFPKEVYHTGQLGFSDHSETRSMDETSPKYIYQTGEVGIIDLSETCSMYKTAPKEIFPMSDMGRNDVSKFSSIEETFPKEIYQTGERDFIDVSQTSDMDETSPKEIYQMTEKGHIDVLET